MTPSALFPYKPRFRYDILSDLPGIWRLDLRHTLRFSYTEYTVK